MARRRTRQQMAQDISGKGKAVMIDSDEEINISETPEKTPPKVPSPATKSTPKKQDDSSSSSKSSSRHASPVSHSSPEIEDIWEREAKKLRASKDSDNGFWRPWPDDDSMLVLCSFIVSSIEHGIPDIKYEAQDVDPDVAVQDASDVAEDDNDNADREVADKVDAENNADTETNADAKDPSSSSSKSNL